MTVPGAVRVIEEVSARWRRGGLVGAGTVLDPETARACILAGARFVVSPALDLETIECCRRYGVAVMPGALTPPEVVRAWVAGADFVKVFPAGALDLETIECCRRYGVAVMPGALTPTEVVRAWVAGADFVKVFPAGALGGASYIKSLKAPLPQVELVPTGGVSLKTAADFIRAGASALGVGAELVDTNALPDR